MPASSLVLYKNNTQAVTFPLAASGLDEVSYLEGGRSINEPHTISISKKMAKGAANNLVYVTLKRVQRNATTGKLATFQVKVEISIPQDNSILSNAVNVEELSLIGSYLIDAAATGATTVNRTALIEGRFA